MEQQQIKHKNKVLTKSYIFSEGKRRKKNDFHIFSYSNYLLNFWKTVKCRGNENRSAVWRKTTSFFISRRLRSKIEAATHTQSRSQTRRINNERATGRNNNNLRHMLTMGANVNYFAGIHTQRERRERSGFGCAFRCFVARERWKVRENFIKINFNEFDSINFFSSLYFVAFTLNVDFLRWFRIECYSLWCCCRWFFFCSHCFFGIESHSNSFCCMACVCERVGFVFKHWAACVYLYAT